MWSAVIRAPCEDYYPRLFTTSGNYDVVDLARQSNPNFFIVTLHYYRICKEIPDGFFRLLAPRRASSANMRVYNFRGISGKICNDTNITEKEK